jgi:ADP-ribosyl-[dinitrogen reductase] hydrolase
MNDLERLTALGLHPGEWHGQSDVFPHPAPSASLRDRYRGCLVGGAIGDALGSPVESWPRSAVRRSYAKGLRDFQPGRGWSSGAKGTVTDDTQLTIETAEWLINAGERPPCGQDMGLRVAEWGRVGRGIGRATRQALWNYEMGMPWWEAGVASAGNGAAMRAAPFGLRFAGQPDALRYAAALGSVTTHRDATAVTSAIVQAAAVNHCLVRSSEELAADDLLATLVAALEGLDAPQLELRSAQERRSLPQRIGEVHDFLGRPADEAFDHFFNGAFVLETTPIVLWLFLTYADDPEEALVAAVMGGRDADTTAAMLGNLIGALHGEDALPDRWRGENLEDYDRLVDLADRLYALRWEQTDSPGRGPRSGCRCPS